MDDFLPSQDESRPQVPGPAEAFPAPELALPLERLWALMETGQMQEGKGRIRWSSNYTFLMSLCDEEGDLRAIYKPQQGERPLWDFPDGSLCYRERAAFLISEALGWWIVPPTLLRAGPLGVGSLQLYIEHNPEITYFNLGEGFHPQLQRFAAFDYVTNNADRKGGHCLLGPGGKVWGIDHGLCFHVANKLRTVIWEYGGMEVPAHILEDVAALQTTLTAEDSPLREALLKLISGQELEALLRRAQRFLRAGVFPEPGHGPSYPWPPV
jgi:uncharacterized repeat protein (TIGR03843 family)